MGRRTIKNVNEKIIDGVLKETFKNGISNLSTKKLTAKLGISEPVLFSHFKTKQGLFDAVYSKCAENVHFCKGLPAEKVEFEKIWNVMENSINEMMSHPKEVVFMNEYRHSCYYNPALVRKLGSEELSFFDASFHLHYPMASNEQAEILTDNLLEQFIMIAAHLSRKDWPDTKSTRKILFMSVIYGLYGPQLETSFSDETNTNNHI